VASIFTKIIRGELPGRFVWRDDRAVGFLTIEPLTPGHTLVVPVEEVDHWIDLEPELASHLMRVAQNVGQAQQRAFRPTRIGMVIVGIEVPHVHLHVTPIRGMGDLNFANANRSPKPADLDAAAEKIRAELRALGFAEVAD
jgi:histidine triad (HIT) family protein